MKITLSNFGWILFGVALIVLLIVLLKDGCGPKPDIVLSNNDSLQSWVNKQGDTIKSLKKKEEDYFVERKGFVDSIAKLYNSKTKYIREVVKITEKGEVQIVNTETPIVKYVDSNNCPRIIYQAFENPYYLAEATLDTHGDSSKLLLETTDTLSVVWKQVKEGGLFNRKTFLQLDLSNANPYNHITGAEVYRVPQKVNAWNKWIKPTLVGIAAATVTYQLTKK